MPADLSAPRNREINEISQITPVHFTSPNRLVNLPGNRGPDCLRFLQRSSARLSAMEVLRAAARYKQFSPPVLVPRFPRDFPFRTADAIPHSERRSRLPESVLVESLNGPEKGARRGESCPPAIFHSAKSPKLHSISRLLDLFEVRRRRAFRNRPTSPTTAAPPRPLSPAYEYT